MSKGRGTEEQKQLDGQLLKAAAEGNEKGVIEALSAGADVNARDDKNRYTALHKAAEKGYTDIAQALIGMGADMNALNNLGEAPIHTAIVNRHDGVAKALVEGGADMTIQSGQTSRLPQRMAFDYGSSAEVKTFIVQTTTKQYESPKQEPSSRLDKAFDRMVADLEEFRTSLPSSPSFSPKLSSRSSSDLAISASGSDSERSIEDLLGELEEKAPSTSLRRVASAPDLAKASSDLENLLKELEPPALSSSLSPAEVQSRPNLPAPDSPLMGDSGYLGDDDLSPPPSPPATPELASQADNLPEYDDSDIFDPFGIEAEQHQNASLPAASQSQAASVETVSDPEPQAIEYILGPQPQQIQYNPQPIKYQADPQGQTAIPDPAPQGYTMEKTEEPQRIREESGIQPQRATFMSDTDHTPQPQQAEFIRAQRAGIENVVMPEPQKAQSEPATQPAVTPFDSSNNPFHTEQALTFGDIQGARPLSYANYFPEGNTDIPQDTQRMPPPPPLPHWSQPPQGNSSIWDSSSLSSYGPQAQSIQSGGLFEALERASSAERNTPVPSISQPQPTAGQETENRQPTIREIIERRKLQRQNQETGPSTPLLDEAPAPEPEKTSSTATKAAGTIAMGLALMLVLGLAFGPAGVLVGAILGGAIGYKAGPMIANGISSITESSSRAPERSHEREKSPEPELDKALQKAKDLGFEHKQVSELDSSIAESRKRQHRAEADVKTLKGFAGELNKQHSDTIKDFSSKEKEAVHAIEKADRKVDKFLEKIKDYPDVQSHLGGKELKDISRREKLALVSDAAKGHLGADAVKEAGDVQKAMNKAMAMGEGINQGKVINAVNERRQINKDKETISGDKDKAQGIAHDAYAQKHNLKDVAKALRENGVTPDSGNTSRIPPRTPSPGNGHSM